MAPQATETLDKLLTWVKSQGKTQEKRSAPWSWVTGLVVTAVALVTVAFMAWRARKQGRELAKLKHARDLMDQDIQRKKVVDQVSMKQKDAHLRRTAIKEAESRLDIIDKRLVLSEEARITTGKAIDDLKNWRDVDRYLAADDTSSR